MDRPRHTARIQMAEAAALLNDAARAITVWASTADRIVLAPDEDGMRPFLGHPDWSKATLDERCTLARQVGEMAARCASWAEGLAE